MRPSASWGVQRGSTDESRPHTPLACPFVLSHKHGQNSSTKLAQNPNGHKKTRCLGGFSWSVDCWDWTKAIALPRVPEPCRKNLRLDLPESWARCPRPQSPHVSYISKNLCS